MNLIDLVTYAVFGSVIICGLMLIVMQDLRGQRPDARVKSRVEAMFVRSTNGDSKRVEINETFFNVEKQQNSLSRWLDPKRARLQTVAGDSGVRIVIAAAIVMEIAVVIGVNVMPLPWWLKPIALVGMPMFAMVRAYKYLEERFRRRFLDGFSDLIDMIVRAVRAGVPVTQVMANASDECPEPLKTEFKRMADSLSVGRDLEDVLEVAMDRIQIADFGFFCVCLLLQRETGGQLGETLENLSGIVRTRREVRQKTKALTAEARITTKILSAIPVIIMAAMYGLNRASMMQMFHTETGQKMLTFSFISVVLGIIVIGKMSKLDTSR